MPPKKGYSKRRRKRRSRPRQVRRGIKPSVLNLKGVSAVPDTMYCYLKYHITTGVTDISGFASQVFSINSLFDPSVTGGGHQPLGFDQWANFYDEYEVLSSSLTVLPIASENNPITMALYPSITSTAATSINMASEQPYSKVMRWSNTTGSNLRGLKNWMSVRKLEGRNTNSVNFTATTGSSPTNQRFWVLILKSGQGASLNNILLDVTMIFKCKFFRRKVLSLS